MLFIYPAGVCHQINIIKYLPARNKYLAERRKYAGSLMTGLDGEHEMAFSPQHMENHVFINKRVPPLLFIVPLSIHLPYFPN